MTKKYLLFIPLIALLVVVFMHQSDTTANADPTASPTPTPTPHATSHPSPTPVPVDTLSPNARMDAMATSLSTPRSFHVSFTGSDARGTVAFNVYVDGHGNLSGTYSRGNVHGEIMRVDGVLYIHGAAVAASYAGEAVPASMTSWIRMPSWVPQQMFATLTEPLNLQACVNADREDVDTWNLSSVVYVNGLPAERFVRVDPDATWSWEYEVGVSSDSPLEAWNYLPPVGTTSVPACNGGVIDTGSPTSQMTGMMVFSGYGPALAPISAPRGAESLDTGSAPEHDTGPTG